MEELNQTVEPKRGRVSHIITFVIVIIVVLCIGLFIGYYLPGLLKDNDHEQLKNVVVQDEAVIDLSSEDCETKGELNGNKLVFCDPKEAFYSISEDGEAKKILGFLPNYYSITGDNLYLWNDHDDPDYKSIRIYDKFLTKTDGFSIRLTEKVGKIVYQEVVDDYFVVITGEKCKGVGLHCTTEEERESMRKNLCDGKYAMYLFKMLTDEPKTVENMSPVWQVSLDDFYLDLVTASGKGDSEYKFINLGIDKENNLLTVNKSVDRYKMKFNYDLQTGDFKNRVFTNLNFFSETKGLTVVDDDSGSMKLVVDFSESSLNRSWLKYNLSSSNFKLEPIDRDSLILVREPDDIYAVNALTGKVVWEKKYAYYPPSHHYDRDGKIGYFAINQSVGLGWDDPCAEIGQKSTCGTYFTNEENYLNSFDKCDKIFTEEKDKVIAIDLQTGDVMWSYKTASKINSIMVKDDSLSLSYEDCTVDRENEKVDCDYDKKISLDLSTGQELPIK